MIAADDLPGDIEDRLGPLRRIRAADAIGKARALQQQEKQVKSDDAGLEQGIGRKRQQGSGGAGDVLGELGLRRLAVSAGFIRPRRCSADDVFQLAGHLNGAGLHARPILVEPEHADVHRDGQCEERECGDSHEHADGSRGADVPPQAAVVRHEDVGEEHGHEERTHQRGKDLKQIPRGHERDERQRDGHHGIGEGGISPLRQLARRRLRLAVAARGFGRVDHRGGPEKLAVRDMVTNRAAETARSGDIFGDSCDWLGRFFGVATPENLPS